MPSSQRRSRKKIFLEIVAAFGAVVVAWVLYDLYAPHTAHLREFDADEVARLETAMWRSYYEKQELDLFNELSELLRTQYDMPLLRSNRVAYYRRMPLSSSSREVGATIMKKLLSSVKDVSSCEMPVTAPHRAFLSSSLPPFHNPSLCTTVRQEESRPAQSY